jgi:hypothetical protein
MESDNSDIKKNYTITGRPTDEIEAYERIYK